MNKTDHALAAIFRHCDEVQSGVRPTPSEREGDEAARLFLGIERNKTKQQ